MNNVIVMPADSVGYEIIKYLSSIKEPILCLILDESDRGNYNEKIISTFRSYYKNKPIYYNRELKDDNIIANLEKLKPYMGILAYWPFIIKGKILKLPEIGWLNCHPSYLPYNRGKHASFWAIVEETVFGASLQFIDEGIDTGDYVVREKIEYDWSDTGKTLYEKSKQKLVEIFKKNYLNIKNNRLKKISQNLENGSYHSVNDIGSMSQIDLDKNYTARDFLNIIRAKMSPPAFFYDKGKKYSIEIEIKEIIDDQEHSIREKK